MRKIHVVVVNLFQSKSDQILKYYKEGARVEIELVHFEVQGPDAFQYLKSQTTNTIKNEVLFHGPQCLLETKGRVNSFFSLNCTETNNFLCTLLKEEKDSWLERFERFHIAEEFEVKEVSGPSFCSIGEENKNSLPFWFCGFNLNLHEEPPSAINVIKSSDLSFWGGFLNTKNKILNETRFFNLAYSKSKGCFPGGESVSKVDSGRGAAYFPVLIKINSSEDLSIDGKRVARFIDERDGLVFYELLRNYRIDEREVEFDQGKGAVYTFPVISQSKKEIALKSYDEALEIFTHKNLEDEAIEKLEFSLKCDPNLENAYEMLGVMYGRKEKYTKAVELMEKLERLNGDSIMAKTNLSLYHMKLGNIETAEDYKGQATTLEFQRAGVEYEQKENLKKNEEEQKRKEEMFHQVLEIDESDDVANFGLGKIYLDRKEYAKAAEKFNLVIDFNKKHSVSYLELGRAHFLSKDFKQAKEILKKGVEIAASQGDLMPANEMQALLNQIKL